ncbi:MAG TPA: 1-phosphofructokinase family hexose kinase [Gaiellaceae bacterium]|nr:1-phosphofructokinase family hexose kinase [Gaiellaceae bacterium]
MIVTVTMNAALDRVLTVPNFQRGHRHRASEKLTLAGGKGIIVARALKRLGVPVVATGLVGGRNGRRIVEELTEEAVLNDLVRIEDESRTSTAVIDPTSGEYTEIIEWGPLVHAEELDTLRDKIEYLSRGAEMVVFAGSLPRGVDESFYAEMVRELNRRGVSTVLDTEGEPLRLGVEAEPELVTPNQLEAESLVGQEFSDEEDFVLALDTIRELGARNVILKHERGVYAHLRREKERGKPLRFRVDSPPVEVVSPVGAGSVLLGAFIAARLDRATPEEALRRAVAAGTASTLMVGSGEFDLAESTRLVSEVSATELTSVAAER